ncbi:AAA family ATPase [Leptospira interrogans]|uniref:AAA family ATPase n=1 Tax=Leptospira interrogans serovar Pomona TaxID=44276 RepID=A0AA40WDN5_LEPIR|nr:MULTISPECIES: AAA family ATPase [Leptospira]AJR15305.1 anticodon nuclease [Leptospira interrogans serovar Linhai str. 56609]EJO79085.1 AAA domain protein [Leptospira interrogans serovar Pomona str. Kennewicki LC82-25]EKN97052.1 AAA domain protein [Leptospira interrogans serovar Pomona str. Pomona]EMF34750.1 AAA domain protein [Leptospira interrogans serovar Pomona str. Fox 32256]EMI66343.1 AAA domain protein [Leptospira interrogans serovar Pomona str. CSL10083]
MSMDIVKLLKDADQKVQLLYAFNGTGKTRLSREFKQLVAPKNNRDEADQAESSHNKILYYNASTEDLFFWDNDLEKDAEPKLKIQSNSFTDWILKDQGQDRNIITNFQHYTNEKLTPRFNEAYTVKDKNEQEVIVKEFSEVTFSLTRGNEEHSGNLKISKGEESNFIWSIFYSLLEQVISVLNVIDSSEQETDQFDQLEYVFIDDPVSSLDENHLIELAAELIQSSKSDIRFLITTHNPLFYNVLHNEFKKDTFKKYILKKQEDESYELANQSTDSPFSYHLHLKAELEKAIETGQLHKYHFNFLRNILEKTSTFVGLERWGDLLPKTEDGDPNPYEVRIINFSSHSKHSDNEVVEVPDEHRRVLSFLVKKLDEMYRLRMRTK